MKDVNREEHQGLEEHEDPFSPKRMRGASPLSPEAERVMHATIGCAIAVHRSLGPGFLESIYRKAMCIELEARKLAFDCERSVDILYRGVPLSGQQIDLILENDGAEGRLVDQFPRSRPQRRVAKDRPVIKILRDLPAFVFFVVNVSDWRSN